MKKSNKAEKAISRHKADIAETKHFLNGYKMKKYAKASLSRARRRLDKAESQDQ